MKMTDYISKAQAIERLQLNFPISAGADDSKERYRYMQALADTQAIRESPTVEAIPKSEYEARLKADMVTMLTEIQLTIEELRAKKHFQYKYGQEHGLNDASEIIQERIDALRGGKNDK